MKAYKKKGIAKQCLFLARTPAAATGICNPSLFEPLQRQLADARRNEKQNTGATCCDWEFEGARTPAAALVHRALAPGYRALAPNGAAQGKTIIYLSFANSHGRLEMRKNLVNALVHHHPRQGIFI